MNMEKPLLGVKCVQTRGGYWRVWTQDERGWVEEAPGLFSQGRADQVIAEIRARRQVDGADVDEDDQAG